MIPVTSRQSRDTETTSESARQSAVSVTRGVTGDETAVGTTLDSESYRFLVSIHSVTQAHFYRHAIEALRENGHQIRVCVRETAMISELLTAFDIEHRVLAHSHSSAPGRIFSAANYEIKLLGEAWRFKPDVITSYGGIGISYIAPLVGAKALAVTETPSRVRKLLTAPSIDATCTPSEFEGSVRGEQFQYDGFQELAYLHPDRFEPKPHRLRRFGVDPDKRNFVVGFDSWRLYGDDDTGLSPQEKRELISLLSHHGDVHITSEETVPGPFENYEVSTPPDLFHDLLATADLYIGDSETVATEATLLGTPSIRVVSRPEDDSTNLEALTTLSCSSSDGHSTVEELEELLGEPGVQRQWEKRREELLDNPVDVTTYVVEKLEVLGYESRHEPHRLYE